MGLADRLRELADEAEAMEARLMPEGMAWPMVDGEPVVIGERLVGYGSGDDGYKVVGVRPTCGWVLVKSCDHIHRDEGPVILEWDASKCRRPAPKVLDADGVPLSEGETVYEVEGTGHAYKVVGIRVGDGDPLTPTVVTCDEGDGTSEHFLPSQLTHRAPVLAADGEPLEVGQTVWTTRDHDEFTVVDTSSDEEGFLSVKCRGKDGKTYFAYPGDLTHQRPVLDADGVEIHVGDTVCGTRDMEPMRVVDADSRECGFKHIKCEKDGDGFFFYCADELTHKLPVLAADGEPLEVGQTVWRDDGERLEVLYLRPDGLVDCCGEIERPERLTHERPDSWERLEEDARELDISLDGENTSDYPRMSCVRDLVRRCRALAERGQ